MSHAVHVAGGELYAGPGQVDVCKVGRVVVRTNVTLSGERRHRDCVLVQDRNVVGDAAINVILRSKTRSLSNRTDWHNL